MTSLKAIMKEKLDKGKGKGIQEEKTPVTKTPGRLQEFFDNTIDDTITDEEIKTVIEEGVPYLEEDDPNYHHHVRQLAKIKRDNPTLYAKMKAWD